LAKLEHNGYIVRTPSDTDHRAVNISWTPQRRGGRPPENRPFGLCRMLDGMTDEEKETLNALLDKVIDGLKTRRALSRSGPAA
jgi:DNA-binding MarR family transcriptional regulator